MIIKQVNYTNGFGEIVSKEVFEIERAKFENEVEFAYNKKANEILSKINNIATNDTEKLWILYDYLTADNMHYNLQETTQDGRLALDIQYDFAPYTTWKISHSTKYPALLNNAGVCKTFSLAFEDLANKLGIPCRVVTGFTGMEHAWNIVLIHNQIKHIDVAYALMFKEHINKKNYFLKNLEELGSRTIDLSVNELIIEMQNQYNQIHPKINVINRSDMEPKIHIISPFDIQPKINITNRTDAQEEKERKK